MENNSVKLLGKVNSKPEFSHEVFGEKFYTFQLEVDRLSEAKDIIPILISETLVEIKDLEENVSIYVEGEYRSYNEHENGKTHLILSVFAKALQFADFEYGNLNQIFLQGFLCKPPIYRKTPLGREIADMLVAVNRPYGKSDYVPCIAWGRNARLASGLDVGDQIQIWGRIQSREYVKKLSEQDSEKRTAQEVSISKLEQVF